MYCMKQGKLYRVHGHKDLCSMGICGNASAAVVDILLCSWS